MSKQEKRRITIGLVINIILFVLSIICLLDYIRYLVNGNPDIRFRYFTNISTLVVGLTSIIKAAFLFASLLKGEMVYPKGLSIFGFVGLTMTALTFFIVLISSPFVGLYKAYSNIKIITHLILPILTVISYLFFEEKKVFEWEYSLIHLVPVLSYSFIYWINVVVIKQWPDLYKVNTNGHWYVGVIIAIISSVFLSQGLYFIKKRLIKKINQPQ